MCKKFIGGGTITYVDKAESGMDYTKENLLYHKLNKQTSKAHRLRVIWFIWLTCAIYLMLVPFTAELAKIPIIGGCLLKFES